MLADENDRTYGRIAGQTTRPRVASSAPAMTGGPDTRFKISARWRLYPAESRMAKSPTSCGISCAATAIAVLIAERNGRQHGRADDRAVDEVVKGVAEDHQLRRRAVHLTLVACGSGAAAPASPA